MPALYPDKQRQARNTLGRLFANPSNVRVIHYSCESFDNQERSPRVTSIAIRRLDTGQTESFSIHAVAEEREIAFAEIDAHYNTLEKEMLERFYRYAGTTVNATDLHWNMRDANYGFTALAHRLKVLQGEPGEIPEAQRYDLARILQDMYGNEYIEKPKLQNLAKKNGFSMLDFLAGAQEPERFKQKNYVALHRSTLRKVDMIADVAERAYRSTLKTNASWWVQRGGAFGTVVGWVMENPRIAFLVGFIGLLATLITSILSIHR